MPTELTPLQLPTLTGRHIRLRAFRPSDASLIQAASSDDLIPLISSVPTSTAHDEAIAFIDRQHDRLITRAGYSFAVADLESNDPVGQIGLWLHDIKDNRANIGYWIAKDHRRRGYAADALATVVDWALGMTEIDRLELYVEPWNEGSWRTAENVGLKREGLLRKWQEVGTVRKDMFMYSLLPGEQAEHRHYG